jgi:hypothetical protein
MFDGTWAELIKAGASAARADYCFVIGAGLVPTGSWTLALSDGIDQIQNPDEAGFLPHLPRPGLFESVKVALLTQKALLTGRSDHRHALSLRKPVILRRSLPISKSVMFFSSMKFIASIHR